MADTSLQDRLRESQEAFHGLLSLIPAKMYYGEEKSDQWMKKKQTKGQAKAAKRGKLDPDSELNRSAKEELEERARTKRKLRELESDNESDDDVSDASFLTDVEKEKPLEGLKKLKVQEPSDNDEPTTKKVKVDEDEQTSTHKKKSHQPSADPSATPNKKMTKEEKKSAKKVKKEGKLKAKLEKTPSNPKTVEDATPTQTVQESTEVDEPDHEDDMMPMDISGLVPDEAESTGRSISGSPVFDSTAGTARGSVVESVSSTTSVSSTAPSSAPHPPRIKLPKDTEALKKRLEDRLEALRAGRRGTNDKQPRTRQELIEERREKQLKRKAHKREMRLKAKEEEDRKREEALASARNSPLHLPTFNDPDADRSSNHFAFGRLTFSDGALMSHDLTYEKSADAKRKGPSDPKTALAKLEAQKKRLASLDEDKRKEVLEKETWLAARRRAEGEKVHDNEALLKKAVKRKEKAKKKSEKEWKERAAGVDKAIKDRQCKREENLKKRRDEKGAKGKKKGGPSKPKNRPGFEGSFGVKRK